MVQKNLSVLKIPNERFGASVETLSPATIANLVCGFDILGMAVEEPFDWMKVRLIETPTVTIKHNDPFGLPVETESNVAGVVLRSIIEKFGNKFGFEIEIEKHIKPGSGIGSSAATAAGAAVSANILLGNILDTNQMVQFAMNGEKLASGVKHADNIAPCILGGINLIRSIHPLDIIQLPSPQLHVTIVHPQIEVRTSDARQILRDKILLKDAVKQWGNIGGLITGFLKNDYELIGRSLEDHIIEPVRSILIPGFDEIRAACRQRGALGGGICGSGPSIFMFSESREIALECEKAMKVVYEKIGLEILTYVTKISERGVKEIKLSS